MELLTPGSASADRPEPEARCPTCHHRNQHQYTCSTGTFTWTRRSLVGRYPCYTHESTGKLYLVCLCFRHSHTLSIVHYQQSRAYAHVPCHGAFLTPPTSP